jgi:hypothetical protein
MIHAGEAQAIQYLTHPSACLLIQSSILHTLPRVFWYNPPWHVADMLHAGKAQVFRLHHLHNWTCLLQSLFVYWLLVRQLVLCPYLRIATQARLRPWLLTDSYPDTLQTCFTPARRRCFAARSTLTVSGILPSGTQLWSTLTVSGILPSGTQLWSTLTVSGILQ